MEGVVNNLDLFMILSEQLHSLSDSSNLFQFLQEKINVSEENSAELQKFCTRFCSNINARWERSSRMLAQFIKKNGDWLESAISWPAGIIPEPVDTEQRMSEVYDEEDVENLPPSTAEASTSTFTPRKPFQELSSRQKRRRVDEMNKSFLVSPDELNATTIANLRNTGYEDVGKIMHHLLNNPEDLEKVKECLSAKVKSNQYSPDKALSLLVSLKLSRWQYISLREAASENGSDLYPSYYKIKQAKSQCYPGKENITITEDGAAIKLQALLNLTVSRLLDVIALDLNSTIDLVLISKWGLDGASGQSNYKQKTETDFDDSTIFMSSLVPIRLQQSDGTIVWENDRPSSTFYCRPIMFKFTKETQSTVVSTKDSIEEEIDGLQPSRFSQVEVTHKLIMTMIDGKIASYLSGTSSSVCDICKAKPSEMKNLSSIAQREKNEDMYQYGLSSLHAWIRSMECLLHIAYRLEFKKWSCRGDDKEKMTLRKSAIQQSFRSETGLLIDIVKQGVGTTNDGNTARRFFRDPPTTARITGISLELIERFHVILQTVASGERVDLTKLSEYCNDTTKLYVNLYPWYNMPHSVHKLLVHGADIIKHFGAIPIGKLSEEAAEARNKDFRNYRESHSRKVSRTTNEDILHNLLLSSDPKITSLRPQMRKQNIMVLPLKVKELLISFPTESDLDFIDVNNLQDSHSDSE